MCLKNCERYTKVCSKCGEEKELDEFYKDRAKSDGLRGNCKQCVKKYFLLNKEKKSLYNRNYKSKNREAIAKYNKKYKIEKLNETKEYNKTYYKKNKQKINQYRVKYAKQRMEVDLCFKIRRKLSSRVSQAIKRQRGIKACSTIELLGCSIEKCRQHLENLFTESMSWNNYGKWHIDHIIPCSSFDLTEPEQQKKCFHYTNLQPLWAEDNLKKSNK
jgi:hypothetical protein